MFIYTLFRAKLFYGSQYVYYILYLYVKFLVEYLNKISSKKYKDCQRARHVLISVHVDKNKSGQSSLGRRPSSLLFLLPS